MQSTSPPRSLDPISTIIEAFRTHTIVALNDDHGEERCSAFRISLIRDPRFIETVNAIVVEFGNSKYQAVIDAFVSGDSVSEQKLRAVWQDTTTPRAVWDRPIYEEFFRAVRGVNAGRPANRQLRVLLGDPPIDWQHVRTLADLRKSSNGRSIFPAELIAREVIAKHRRALVIYGGLHLMRQNLQGENLIERLDTHAPGTAFVVIGHPFANLAALGIESRSWQQPTLVLTSGTSLANQLDAILYLGPPSGRRTSRISAALCNDPTYRSMRIGRIDISGDDRAREQFARECTNEK
jgi:hypothetical protein